MKIFAHRGFSGRYPENTMIAFQKAFEEKCDGIELDVQLTKDGKVIVLHDEKLDRTCDAIGYVREYNFEDLKNITASKLWDCEKQHIPSLEEYLEWVCYKDIVTNIEIKSGVYYYSLLEEKTLELVKKYGVEEKVIFSSFNHSSIHLLRHLAPHIPCGALVENEGLGNPGYYCKKFGFEYYHPGYKNLTYEDMQNCKEYGIPINVWTVNDMDVMQRMIEWDVNAVITNYPNICRKILK